MYVCIYLSICKYINNIYIFQGQIYAWICVYKYDILCIYVCVYMYVYIYTSTIRRVSQLNQEKKSINDLTATKPEQTRNRRVLIL